MQFNTRTRKLALTKREQQTLLDAISITNDAERIAGIRACGDAATSIKVAAVHLGIEGWSQMGVSSPSGDTSDPMPPSTPPKK